MINAVFIIGASGGCIFYHEFKKLGSGLDQDLVSGFLVALQNFAKETFGFESTPQKLDLAAGVRLVYSLNQETELLGAAVSDSIDHPKLVQNLIDQILNEFITRFKTKLNKLYEVGQFSGFIEYVEKLIKGKISKRGPLSCFLGILIASLIVPGVFIPSLLLLIRLGVDLTTQIFYLTSLLFIIGGLPQILAGYIAGNKKLAMMSAVILSLVIIPFAVLGGLVNLIIALLTGGAVKIGSQATFVYLVFMPLILPENIALAYFGGYRREIKRLNPLTVDTFL
ncbi:MAG: hypothetical protein EU536_03160 [Promethearchaeota archaeon]|nr:MAG: hypothetical protein EU536_03160 [Candidatus Lokiarchaeota archaeon]